MDNKKMNEIHCIDPVLKKVIRIPCENIFILPKDFTKKVTGFQPDLRTRGFYRCLKREGSDNMSSLCLKYQKDRCHMNSACNQIHACRIFIGALRRENNGKSTCCLKHGDSNSKEEANFLINEKFKFFIQSRGVKSEIKADEIAYTKFFENFRNCNRDFIMIPIDKICRLHLKNNCYLNNWCNQVHICTNFSDIISNTASENFLDQYRTLIHTSLEPGFSKDNPRDLQININNDVSGSLEIEKTISLNLHEILSQEFKCENINERRDSLKIRPVSDLSEKDFFKSDPVQFNLNLFRENHEKDFFKSKPIQFYLPLNRLDKGIDKSSGYVKIPPVPYFNSKNKPADYKWSRCPK